MEQRTNTHTARNVNVCNGENTGRGNEDQWERGRSYVLMYEYLGGIHFFVGSIAFLFEESSSLIYNLEHLFSSNEFKQLFPLFL